MKHIEMLEKSFKTIDKMLGFIVNGLNSDGNIYRYYMLTYYIQRYIQYNIMIGKITSNEIDFTIPIYLRDLYYHLHYEAKQCNQIYRQNKMWSLDENVKQCFDKEHQLFIKH